MAFVSHIVKLSLLLGVVSVWKVFLDSIKIFPARVLPPTGPLGSYFFTRGIKVKNMILTLLIRLDP
jgi:hypothetical protein